MSSLPTFENNVFNNNTTGSIRFDLNNVVDANITLLNNTITNNGTGSAGKLRIELCDHSDWNYRQLFNHIKRQLVLRQRIEFSLSAYLGCIYNS